MTNAIYAFSGDPITYGHMNIIERAAKQFEHVTVGIGVNPDKKYLFTLDERKELASKALSKMDNVNVIAYQGMLVDYAYENDISVVIRGVRNAADMEFEKNLYEAGKFQNLGVETFLLLADPKLSAVSSSVVKELQKYQGAVHELVPLVVKESLERKISGQYIIGITGEMGSGKSYVSKKLVDIGATKGVSVHNIELDNIGHDILATRTEPVYKRVREEIIDTFGDDTALPNNMINRKVLGEKVFGNKDELDKLNSIMQTPLMERLRLEMYGKKGLILVNAALLAESNLSYIHNNNTLLISVGKDRQYKRLAERGLDKDQIERRLSSQYTLAQKEALLTQEIIKADNGQIWTIDTTNNATDKEIETVLDKILVSSKL